MTSCSWAIISISGSGRSGKSRGIIRQCIAVSAEEHLGRGMTVMAGFAFLWPVLGYMTNQPSHSLALFSLSSLIPARTVHYTYSREGRIHDIVHHAKVAPTSIGLTEGKEIFASDVQGSESFLPVARKSIGDQPTSDIGERPLKCRICRSTRTRTHGVLVASRRRSISAPTTGSRL